VLIEEGSERILVAHLLAPYADDAINLFAHAIAANLPAARVRDTLSAYPTVASDILYMLVIQHLAINKSLRISHSKSSWAMAISRLTTCEDAPSYLQPGSCGAGN